MNESELEVARRYEAAGWRIVRGGAPDFLAVKTDESGKILDKEFVEVKRGRGLTYTQAIYKKVLESLGAKFSVVTVSPSRTKPGQAKPPGTDPIRSIPCRPGPSQPKPKTKPGEVTR